MQKKSMTLVSKGEEMSREQAAIHLPVHLKVQNHSEQELRFMCGVFCGVIGIPAISGLMHGDWGFLPLFLIPLVILLVARFLGRIIRGDYAILFEDRMELPLNGQNRKEFLWADVNKIWWSKGQGAEYSAKIYLSSRSSPPFIPVQLGNLSLEDGVILIHYLREKASQIEQENWPQFCRRCAIPWVESLQKGNSKKKADADENSRASGAMSVFEKLLIFYKHWPFVAGFFVLAYIVLFFLVIVPRKTWWILSLLIACSTVLNMLVINHWNNFFTNAILVFCGILFLMGVFAVRTPEENKNNPPEIRGGWPFLAIGIIGLPFLLAIAEKGWIRRDLPAYGLGLFLITLFAFVLIYVKKTTKHQQRVGNISSDEIQTRWGIYQRTGHLPDSVSQDMEVG